MNAIFQYIAATVIVVLTLGFTLYAVASSAFIQSNSSTQYQLYPVAENLMDNFVLYPGSPYDWGSNMKIYASNLSDFGLAVAPNMSLGYSLDPNKLNRIVQIPLVNTSIYIPSTTAGRLLGIYQNNHFNYGFDFKMVPALNINIVNRTAGRYNITVTDYLGRPAINANVNATYFVLCESSQGKSAPVFGFNSKTAYNVTNLLGSALLNLSKPNLPAACIQGNSKVAYLVIATASYYGIKFQSFLTSVTCRSEMVIQGQYLIASFNSTNNQCYDVNGNQLAKSNASVHAGDRFTVFEITSNLGLIINPAVACNSATPPCSILNNGNKNETVVQLQNPVSSSVVLAGVIIKTQGRTFFVVASNPVTTPYGTIEYTSNSLTTLNSNAQGGLKVASVNSAVTIVRFVNVGQNTWVATLTLWRMGQ